MKSPRIIFFDLETRLWASDLRPDDEEMGWDALRTGKGGVSALAIYDTADSFLHLYDDHTIRAAGAHLERADLVVGYCSSKFDVPVVEGLIGKNLKLRYHIDIYLEITRASAERGIVGTKGDFTLGAVCKRNLGRSKIEHGSNARELARTGQWGRLFNYCADDVRLTRDLFAKMCSDGGLINPNGKFLSLPVPDWVRAWAKE